MELDDRQHPAPAGPSAGPSAGSLVGEVEGRLVGMATLVRLGTSAFLYLPIAKWDLLQRPWIAVAVALSGTVEALWFLAATRLAGGRLPRRTVVADVAFCVVLMVAGSRAVRPDQRDVVMTELIPFALGSSAVVGTSTLTTRAGIAAVAGLMLAWVASLVPVLPLKTASDLLGFVLWFVIGRAVSAGWRHLAEAADVAREQADRAWRELARLQRRTAARQRRRQLARHRETLHREVHDFLLPVVEHVAAERPVTPEVVSWAERTARRARLRLENAPGAGPNPLVEQLSDAVTAAEARGVRVETSLATRARPPAHVVEAVVAAATEALTNVAKHAGVGVAVLAALDDGDGGLIVTVRDRGRGFDPRRVAAGGGLAATFAAARSHGVRIEVRSRPGAGSRVSIGWRPAAGERSRADG